MTQACKSNGDVECSHESKNFEIQAHEEKA